MSDSDLADLRKKCIENVYLCAENVVMYLDHGKDIELSKLRNYLKSYLLSEAQQNVEAEVLEEVGAMIDTTEPDQIKDIVSRELEKRTRNNVDSHQYMVEFKKRIEKAARLATQNLNESELAITSTSQTFIDPITKKVIQNPMRNTNCGHVYEREVILNYMKTRNERKCPVAGCIVQQPLQIENLVSDGENPANVEPHHSNDVQDSDEEFSQEY